MFKQSMKFCHIYKSNYLGKDNKVFLKEKKEEKSVVTFGFVCIAIC